MAARANFEHHLAPLKWRLKIQIRDLRLRVGSSNLIQALIGATTARE